MALIDYTYFTGIIAIDTGREDTKEYLSEIIDYCEVRYLTLAFGSGYDPLDYESNDDVKNMLAYFTYYIFVFKQIYSNSPMGNVVVQGEGSSVSLDFDSTINAYNSGVELFDSVKTTDETLENKNQYGI